MMMRILSLMMVLVLGVSCMGTFKRSICSNENRLDIPQLVGNFYRQLPNGRKLKTVVEKKSGTGVGVYQLTRFFDKEETTSNTTELRVCKIDEKLIVEYQMLEGWLPSEREQLTFSYLSLEGNDFSLSAIDYYEYVNNEGTKTTGTLDNTEMSASETMTAFKTMAPIKVVRVAETIDSNWEFTNDDMNQRFEKYLEGK